MRPTNEEIEDLALRLEIDYREHRYQNCQRAASMLRRLAVPEGGTPVAWAVMNSQGVLHSLTLVFETAEHNAKVCKQTVVPLYRSIPQKER